ncbi:MAG: single-stranded-DNA-specific exonuclease RecJ [Geobacteraceae bacterium]
MEPVTVRLWRLKEAEPALVERLAGEAGIPPLLALILANRGFSEPVEAKRFLSGSLADIHDPLTMLGMESAVDRLLSAVTAGEKVCVYGDYDVDGITAVALLIDFFRKIGLDSLYYIPNRLVEGYGLSIDGVRSVAAAGAKVIVTVDCGITAVEEAHLCAELGIALIITDHHTPGPFIPSACAVINPLQSGCPFPFKYLSGVGLAYNLAIALRGALRRAGHFDARPEPNLREYLDLVALGTVADIVPLVGENRIFVKHGLNELTRSARPGVQALKKVAGVDGPVTCGAVGFRLAPRLNAAGRLEDAALGVELLLCNDRQRVEAIACELNTDNLERQTLEQEILREALDMVGNDPLLKGRKSIVLASDTWHPGVIGIVASRIVELFYRPTILIAMQNGNGRGSGRSIPNFHLYDALRACSEHLLKFGGHKYAAGIAIDEANLEKFASSFDAVAGGLLSDADLIPELAIDGVITSAELTLELAGRIEALAPFGMGNPEPLFLLRGARIISTQVLKERHLKLRLASGEVVVEAIGFNLAHEAAVGAEVDLVCSLQINIWKERRGVQLRIRDIRMARTAGIGESDSRVTEF